MRQSLIYSIIALVVTGCATAVYNNALFIEFAPPEGVTAEDAAALRAECAQEENQAKQSSFGGSLLAGLAGGGDAEDQIARKRKEKVLKPCLEARGFTSARMNDGQQAIYRGLDENDKNRYVRQLSRFWAVARNDGIDAAASSLTPTAFVKPGVTREAYVADSRACGAISEQVKRDAAAQVDEGRYDSAIAAGFARGRAEAKVRKATEIQCFKSKGYDFRLLTHAEADALDNSSDVDRVNRIFEIISGVKAP